MCKNDKISKVNKLNQDYDEDYEDNGDYENNDNIFINYNKNKNIKINIIDDINNEEYNHLKDIYILNVQYLSEIH